MRVKSDTIILVLLLAAILLVFPLGRAAQSGTFNVTLTVGNNAPQVFWVNGSFTHNPTENATGIYQFNFNVTDENGAADIIDGTASIVIQLGTVSATSTACTATTVSSTMKAYNCSVAMPYYYNASASWAINASVQDNAAAFSNNTSETFTYNTLKAIVLNLNSISFSGSPGTPDVAAAQGPIRVYDTGNYDFIEMNLTGYELNGTAGRIGAGNFTFNTTSSAVGQAVQNATAVVIANGTINHGFMTNQTVYIYLDIPAGTTGTYTSVQDWTIDAN